MALWPKPKLTRNQIVFEVLLQREEFRPRANYTTLERSVPSRLRKSIGNDWRAYIRDEDLHFAAAFEKAVRKHIPGVYYVVMALEYLSRVPFHIALSHLLGVSPLSQALDLDSVLDLAQFLAEELAIERRQLQNNQPSHVARIRYCEGQSFADSSPEETTRTRLCWVCDKPVSEAAFHAHVAAHLAPPSTPTPVKPDLPTENRRAPAVLPQPCATSNWVTDTEAVETGLTRFTTGRCISCGKLPVPGDYYCYGCLPE